MATITGCGGGSSNSAMAPPSPQPAPGSAPGTGGGTSTGGSGATAAQIVYTANGTTISGFVVNQQDGSLTAAPGSPYSIDAGTFALAAHPNGNLLMAGSNSGQGDCSIGSALHVLTVQADGKLVQKERRVLSSGCLRDLAIDPSGTHLYVTSVAGGAPSVTIFNIAADGTLTENSRQPVISLLDSLNITADGRYVFAILAENGTASYSRNTSTGALTQIEVFSSSGKSREDLALVGSVYYVDTPAPGSSSDVHVNRFDPATGKRVSGCLTTGGAVLGARGIYGFGNTAFMATYSFNGATGLRLGDDTVRSFAVANDCMTLLSTAPNPGGGANEIVVEPKGRFLYTANLGSSVSGFTANASTGVMASVPGSPFSTPSRPEDIVVVTRN
ncbi:MAG TPA: hypothetical protein VM056_01770 [Terriglobales bacterium]|nr:hypothetical protein [Terriglobales bacterium]